MGFGTWTRCVCLGLAICAAPSTAAGQLGGRPAEEWIKMLDAPARVEALRVDEVIARLKLQPGDVVADLGAGSGVFTLPLAEAVGPAGKVYAVEVDQGLVDFIAAKAQKAVAGTVRPILGKFTDPALPARDVDLAFLHDALHHVEDRATYLENAVGYLKPEGRLAVVELDAKTGPHRDNPALQVTREELRAWMAELGFVQREEFPLFDDKWYVVYARE